MAIASSGSSARSDNPLVQLLSSLEKHTDRDPYLILIQHSLSFSQRQIAVSTEKDIAIYRRANIPTPSERGQRDSCGHLWILELIPKHCQLSKVVWVETIAAGSSGVRPSTVPTPNTSEQPLPLQQQSIVYLSAAVDPLGWDSTDQREQQNKSHEISISNLQSLAKRILDEASRHPSTMIVLESILPLIVLHGFHASVNFLKHLLKSSSFSTATSSSHTVLVPVLSDCLYPSQHLILEDLAHAVLILENGEATLLRHGVRERAHLLREQVPFDIITLTNTSHRNSKGLSLLSKESASARQDEESLNSEAAPPFAPPSQTHSMTPIAESNVDGKVVPRTTTSVKRLTGRAGRITLQHDSDDTVSNSMTRVDQERPTKPRIYLEDDDPEFHDIDEEDPDDDLDI